MKTSKLQTLCGLALVSAFTLSSAAFADSAGRAGMAAVDTDGDGKISAAENAAVSAKLFNMVDTDKDGKVTGAEMDAAQVRIAAKRQVKPRLSSSDKIRAIDTNGDGAVSAEENAAMSKSMFDRMDSDKDGFVSAEERAAIRSKLSQKQ